jgi:hypothetical protein
MTEHNQLKEYAKTVLTKLGFESSEIKEEYTVSCYGTGLNRILEDKSTKYVGEKKEQLNKLKKEVEQNESA